jgi:hypothetical protein
MFRPLAFVLALWGCAAYAAELDEARARVNYMLNCQGCHLPDGRGYRGKVPDMRHTIGRFAGVAGGREFLVRVPGAATSPLSDAQLAELMNWMLREISVEPLPGSFSAFTAEEVGALRETPLTDVQALRRELAISAGVAADY